jgi:hypothetical protein
MDGFYEMKNEAAWFEGLADRAEAHTCPTCTRELAALTVKKAGPNTGRRFITCQECANFFWLDRRAKSSHPPEKMHNISCRTSSSSMAWSCLVRMLPGQDLAFFRTDTASRRSKARFSWP